VEHLILPPVERLWQHIIHKGTEDHLTDIAFELVVKLCLEEANVTLLTIIIIIISVVTLIFCSCINNKS